MTLGKLFDWHDIVGHRRQIEVLRRAAESGRAAHAYLFSGREGLGKSSVAAVFAWALLCERTDAGPRPCGACRSCQRPLEEHPDWFLIEPDGKRIRIEQVRTAQRELAYRPHWGRRKVYCFNPADTMTEEAQNSLLKSLEEPPEYASFILVAHQLSGILPTVRSRCTHVRFQIVGTDDIAKALEERGHDAATARLVAGLAFGCPGIALGQDEADLQARRDVILEWSHRLKFGPAAVWHVGEAFEERKDDMEAFVDLLILWYRDILLLASGADEEHLVNRDAIEQLREQAAGVSPAGVADAIQALMKLKQHVLRNANFRLAVDVALLEVHRGIAG